MAKLALTVKGTLGAISLESFVTIINNSFDILKDLDSVISRQPRGSLDWVIDRVFADSIGIEIESKARDPKIDCGVQVAEVYSDGIEIIRSEGITPPYFSDYCLRRVWEVAKVLRGDGANALEIRDLIRHTSTRLDAQIATTASQLMGYSYKSYGSVEGTIEMISIHKPPRFNVYHSIGLQAVRCNLREEDVERVRDNLGRRVVVSGLVSYNAKDEPKSIVVEELEVIPSEDELPTIDQFIGSDPNYTGDMTTEEYIRSIRSG
jgi:hypothetical protein